MKKRVHRIAGRLSALLLVAALLGACSLIKPPPVDLPSREGITPGETITVIGNQNVYGVAKQYNVSMRELIVLNNIRAPYVLKPGQKLTLPADKLPPGGEYSYASYGVSGTASSLAPSPAGAAPAPVSASPGAVEQSELPPIQPAPVSQSTLPPPAPTPPPVSSGVAPAASSAPTAVTALNAPSPPPKAVATTVEGGSTQVASAGDSSVTFTWPVQGPIVSGFGSKGQGLSNDGINISAPKGAPVTAAASGIVVYAGNEMKGFGNLILIRHQGGWVTAYAHLDRALVNKDAVVAQGDMIGTVGKTGDVPSPQLHFETRLNGKPVDPAGVIKAE